MSLICAGCRSVIITGPRNLTDLASAPVLYELEANETQSATINCHVDCLSDGTYNPILLLINAKDKEPLEIPASSVNKADYIANFRQLNFCNASNNYTDFEYDIYLVGDRLDNVLIVCGIVQPPKVPCWGQSHAIISYIATDPPTTTPPTTLTPTESITGLVASQLAVSFTPTVSSLAAAIVILAFLSGIIITVLGCKLKRMNAKSKVLAAVPI